MCSQSNTGPAFYSGEKIKPFSMLEVQIPGQLIPVNQELHWGYFAIYTAYDTASPETEMASAYLTCVSKILFLRAPTSLSP